jgi:hypothetical protein
MSRKCRSFLLFLFGFDSSSSSSRSCVLLLLLPGCRPHVCTVSIGHGRVDGLLLFLDVFFFSGGFILLPVRVSRE